MAHRPFRLALFVFVVFCLMATNVAFAGPLEQTDAPAYPDGYRPPLIHYGLSAQRVEQAPVGDVPVEALTIGLGAPGTFYGISQTFGTNRRGYLEGLPYLNGPNGLIVDSNHNVYVVEENGARLLKYNGSSLVWKAGIAGFHDWGATGLNWPRDVARAPDGTIWIADVDIATQLDPADGDVLQHYPSEPWNVNDDNYFEDMRGVSFDSAGRMYLVDSSLSIVRVYTFNAEGAPEYAATIGDPGNPGSSNTQFDWPAQIVIDSSFRVYVSDVNNNRIQRCTPTGAIWPWGWTCEKFHGNGQGSNEDQLDSVYGLGIDPSNYIYIADRGNYRVKKCTQAGTCSIILTTTNPVMDVGIDPANGQLYISFFSTNQVRTYQSNGTEIGLFAGDASGMPYQTDSQHFNAPRSVRVDSKGNMVFVEESGHRLIKLSPTGTQLWAHGIPGVWGDDDPNLEWPYAVAIDRTGNIWVGGSGPHVRLYSGVNGSLLTTFDDGYGDGNHQFKQVTGIAIDSAGNLYIADIGRQMVFLYNKAGTLVRTYGEEGVCANDNAHFCDPWGITLDRSGNLYVADRWNHRVQKFDKKGNFVKTFSTTVQGERFDQLSSPMDVAVDSKGRVFVADEWNNRVTVYTSTGLYLTTIAGQWSSYTGGTRGAAGVAVDNKGYVYIADQGNHRIQKYAPAVPYAAQLNINGFGKRTNDAISALAVFNGQLYAGTKNDSGWGAQIWRSGKAGWEVVVPDGFNDGANVGIESLIVYKGYLYAGTEVCSGVDCSDDRGGMLFRTQDGVTWEQITARGFGRYGGARSLMNMMIISDGRLCVRTASWRSDNGADIFCSESGDRGTWSLIAQHGMNNYRNNAFPGWAEFNGALYLGTFNKTTGGQVWRKQGTGSWVRVNTDGFGDPRNYAVMSLGTFNGYLYAGTYHAYGVSTDLHGFALYRCQACTGSDWQLIEDNGFTNPNNAILLGFRQLGKVFYAFIENPATGVEVWQTLDGLHWTQLLQGGLGSSNNKSFYWDNAFVTGKNFFIVGTSNDVTGGGVWKICTTVKCK